MFCHHSGWSVFLCSDGSEKNKRSSAQKRLIVDAGDDEQVWLGFTLRAVNLPLCVLALAISARLTLLFYLSQGEGAAPESLGGTSPDATHKRYILASLIHVVRYRSYRCPLCSFEYIVSVTTALHLPELLLLKRNVLVEPVLCLRKVARQGAFYDFCFHYEMCL